MKKKNMTVGQALTDTSTALGRAAAQTDALRAERLAAAREIAAAEGITLEDAITRVWTSATFVAGWSK